MKNSTARLSFSELNEDRERFAKEFSEGNKDLE